MEIYSRINSSLLMNISDRSVPVEHMSYKCRQVNAVISGQFQGRNLCWLPTSHGELITDEIHFLFSISWISTVCPS